MKINIYFKLLLFILFNLLGLLSLYYLFFTDVDWRLFSFELLFYHKLEISGAIIIYFLKLVCDAMKWSSINVLFQIDVSFKKLLYFTCVAPLFDKIIPVPQGESIYAIYCLKKAGVDLKDASLSVFLTKLTGFFTLLFLLPFSFFQYAHLISIKTDTFIYILLFSILSFLCLFFVVKINFKKGNKFGVFTRSLRKKISQVSQKSKENPRVILQVVGLNLTSIFIFSWVIWLLASIYFKIDFYFIFCFVPLVFLSSVVPFVPGFILREGAWISLFVYLDYGKEESTAFGVLLFIFLNSFILIAFFLYLFHVKWKTKHD